MEPLSGAASVIGVASLAIQLCEELKKVHDFWQSVKDAPDDIAHISAEINLFMTWLAVIANNYQRQGFNHRNPNHVAATDTLKLCLATVHDMNDGVKDLESLFSAGSLSRRRASIKFFFRKDKREKVIQQIERMKSLLLIVQTCYIGEIQEAGFRSLSVSLRPKGSVAQATSNSQFLDMPTAALSNKGSIIMTQEFQPIPESVVETVALNPKASPQAPRQLRRSTTKQEGGAYNFGLAMLRFVTTEQESVLVEDSGTERRIPVRQTRYNLRIAQWLLSRSFSWQSFGICNSWQYNFRTFRYIPKDALIVDFCREGDVENVQRMFDKGLASPFDRVIDENGDEWSLLHYSIAYYNVQLCKFLIHCGLGHGSASGISRRPILFSVGEWSELSDPAAHLDILRILVHEGQYDPMEAADGNGHSVMHSFEGSPTVYRWLLQQEEFLIDFEQECFNAWNIPVALIYSHNSNSSSCLEALVADGSLDSFDDRYSLSPWTVVCLFDMADVVDYPKRVKVLWDAGVDFHASQVNNEYGTTLNVLFWDVGYQRSLYDDSTGIKPQKCEMERESIPAPPLEPEGDIIEYDRLEDKSTIKDRPRTSKSLWHTWFPGQDLSILEVAQRYLDAWMEILLEAGIDIEKYGRREDELHPKGFFIGDLSDRNHTQARVIFEYGDHVDGCRIHVTEIWLCDRDGERATSVETSTMPGSWDFDDA